MTSLWWIRRDLRLSDNPALCAALKQGPVIPVFILDPQLLQRPPARRQAFLLGGLAELEAELQKRGSGLVLRRGKPEIELLNLLIETGAQAIFAEEDYTPYARARDEKIANGLPLSLVQGQTVHHPASVLKPDGRPYTVFTPFSKAWKALLPAELTPLPAPEHFPPVNLPASSADLRLLSTESASSLPQALFFPPGEKEALRRLAAFCSPLPPGETPGLKNTFHLPPGEMPGLKNTSHLHPEGGPGLKNSPHLPPGEGPGVRGIFAYHETRNRLDLEGTSALSPYLRFGMISLRQAVFAALQHLPSPSGRGAEGLPSPFGRGARGEGLPSPFGRGAEGEELPSPHGRGARGEGLPSPHGRGAGGEGASAWLNELIWREFYIAILYHFPYVSARAFNPALQNIPWRDDETDFAAWKAGRTGLPVVDAAMRQLQATGWMHNRARMIVASFLVKDLLINWQWGEAWFMQNLLDGDPAANNGGWQWTAGTGTDAAPYFRIFNPVLQSQKFDPDGDYLRKWVPELAHLSTPEIHAPWEKGIRVPGYPSRPIVDREKARERTLRAYSLSKEQTDRFRNLP